MPAPAARSSHRRTSILRAAAQRIARDGVRGLRVTDVAAEAGVSPGLLYYHFTDRAGLLGATLDYINDHANDVRTNGRRGDATPLQELEHQLLSELGDDHEIRENSAAWNELRALAVFESDLRAPMRRSTESWVEEVARSVAAVTAAAAGPDVADPDVAPGRTPDGVPPEPDERDRRTARLLTALVEGLSGRWLAGGLSLAEAHDLLSEAVARLATPAPSRPDTATPPEETP